VAGLEAFLVACVVSAAAGAYFPLLEEAGAVTDFNNAGDNERYLNYNSVCISS